jgi:hypothetical protein
MINGELSPTVDGHYRSLSLSQDCLEWDRFMEGQIPTMLINTVWHFLHQISPWKSITKWGVKFSKPLLSVTNRQWLLHNSNIHHRTDGFTAHQHSQHIDRIHELLMTPVSNLLPCDQHLLQQDFHNLGNADTIHQQLWGASMESAIGSTLHVAIGHFTSGSLHILNSLPSHPAPHRSPFTC